MVVGDPHAEQSELEDCEGLLQLILKNVKIFKPDLVVFLGDQHHNHSLVHLEVMGFWKRAFSEIKKVGEPFGTRVLSLIGNHDMQGNGGSKNHAMLAYDILVPEKVIVANGAAFISYCASEEEFRGLVDVLPPEVKTVFCHQTFDGSKYENGFYAKDGFSLLGLERFKIYSGHIHTPQDIANVTYVGAPRWRTVSDANIDRYLWCLEIEDGVTSLCGKIPTATHCNPLFYRVDNESAPVDMATVDLGVGQFIVDLYGSPEWIRARAKVWGGARIRTFPHVEQLGGVQESKGIHVALSEYMTAFNPSESITKEELRAAINKRLGLSL